MQRLALFGTAAIWIACIPPSHTLDDAGAETADAGRDAGPPEPAAMCWPVTASVEEEHTIELTPAIARATVFFLVDTTASMGDEIAQLRTGLIDVVIPGIEEAIPDVEFAVGEFADYPIPMAGDVGDVVFQMHQTATTDRAAAQSAIAELSLRNGLDRPESLTEALYLSASGEALEGLVPAASCPEGRTGHPCFEFGRVPIYVVLTDAPTHEGPGGTNAYIGITPMPHSFNEAINMLNVARARVVGLYSGEGEGRSDLEELARETGGVRSDGTPIVLDVGSRGELLGTSAVDAIALVATETPLRVQIGFRDIDGDAEDAAAWFTAQRLASVAPSTSLLATPDEETSMVIPGARMSYALTLTAPAVLPAARQRVRIVLAEAGGSIVAVREVELGTACP